MEAARSLFEAQGYAATTMTKIAERAECAERTLFLRFHTKAELLMRVVDETFRGPLEPSNVVPDWVARSRAATTLDGRLRAFAEGAADTLVRTGPLFGVALEAEASEPIIAEAFAAARRETMTNMHRMWRQLSDAGLLHPDVDLQWVADTTGLMAGADTYLLISKPLPVPRRACRLVPPNLDPVRHHPTQLRTDPQPATADIRAAALSTAACRDMHPT